MNKLLPLLILSLGTCGSASAQEVCSATGTALPAEWAAWPEGRQLVSATERHGLGQTGFVPGVAIDLALHPDPEVVYITLPQGEGEAKSFGGLAALHVERAGLYKVGLSYAAWVDLSRDGKPTPTASFGHGPACTPIAKVVSFQLQPGDYTLEISGNVTPELRVMITGG